MNAKPNVWKNYFQMIFRSSPPWLLMAVCFLLSLANAQLALIFANKMASALTDYAVLSDAIGPLFFVFCIGIATVLIKVAGAHLQAIVTAKVDRNVQRYAVSKVFYLKTADVESGDPRELITRLTEDTCKNSPFLVDLMINEIPRLYYIVVATVQVAQVGRPVLTITLLLTIPVIIFGSFIAGRITFKVRNRIQAKIAALTARLAEKIDNAETIKAYGTEESEIASGDEVIMELDKAKKRGAVIDQVTAFIKNMMWFLPLLLIIIPPATLLFNKQITQAEFYAYILIATTFRTYTAQHLDLWVFLKDAQGATLRLSSLLSLDNEKTASGTAEAVSGDIEFQDVAFSYGDGLALDHVSFTLEKGRKTALVGLSGSGKSTALNLIEKFYSPQSGRILLGGTDISQTDYKGYRSLFTYLPQNAPGFDGTVRDMLNYTSKEPHSDEELMEMLRKVDLLDDIMALGGLDYEIGPGGEKLSGGQRQKLGVVRLILSDTEYVLLDEATSALDVEATARVQKAIDEACKGRTQIAVAHDLSTVRNADKILVFDKGCVAAQGTHAELMEASPLYRELVKEVSVS
ncbi:MAG: ABC transporter ATP-binding protein [Firmicutes bacterium]|nr:ABC transporter ATP-binding protein [Bacillota bacterium]